MKARIVHNANFAKFIQGTPLKAGLLEMATDIHRRASAFAPKDTGALVNSGRIESLNDGYRVTFGSSRVPYARIQELGGTIKPKSKPVLAWKDADGEWVYAKSVTIKAKKYLSRAGDSVARGSKAKYFRGKA